MDIRKELLGAIKEEIVGPVDNPKYKDEQTGEEILLRYVHGSPKSRYGAGMLYPQNTINMEEADTGEQPVVEDSTETDAEEEGKASETHKSGASKDDLDFEEPVGLANQFLPSAMGFTVRFNKKLKDDRIELDINTAFYEKSDDQKPQKRINKKGKIELKTNKNGETYKSDFWIRRPVDINPIPLNINSIFDNDKKSHKKLLLKTEAGEPWLQLCIYDRSTPEDRESGLCTYTFALVNEFKSTTDRINNDKHILYQTKLTLTTDTDDLIVPYKDKTRASDTAEEKELNLLYRKKRIFSIGHGVSVSWENYLDEKSQREKVNKVHTSIIPSFEMPQIAPTTHVDLSMLELSDMGDWEEAKKSLNNLADGYQGWIKEIENETQNKLPESYKEAANNAIAKCKTTLNRIKNGIQVLSEADQDSMLVKSFRWMNRAMLWQQQRSNASQRTWTRTRINGEIHDHLDPIEKGKNEFSTLQEFHNNTDWGNWRPFQIAFVLMNIDSVINPESEEREIVDLIWFPTGGGKTEAYLGLSAFTIFYRRLKGDKEFEHEKFGGTTIFMRYTLRLLTTQQYERAASLICACDLIRKKNLELGPEPISIGLWVGGSSTPNDNQKAKSQYRELNSSNYRYASYNFVVMKCPCCAAQIGKISNTSRNDTLKVKGLHKEDGKRGRILFKCDNEHCEYSSKILPLYVADEHIYENPPTLLLGTVDKFAMIPWKKEAGNLFGFRKKDETQYRIKPPELIIQDELHLISGPLGSMVGMYETMIHTLCNDYELYKAPFIKKNKDFIPPKIVASSATISRAKEQVKALYGIEPDNLHIFPSQGLEFGETWFSEQKSIEKIDNNTGEKKYPGRHYSGILASGYPSAQTAIVRAYSALLQKVKEEEEYENIDYYWTLLGYFNSIRELGGAMSLVHGDIRERLYQIQNRELLPTEKRRSLYDWKIKELTSRISSDQIPNILKRLEKKYGVDEGTKSNALDICLATNMVATGVDISRLGLMFIHGQPKTTAEYIQASSRVGRKAPYGPGLVFTLYSPAKPRDKSQYEQFQAYHSRIYSNVEPTSVTPFSVNVRERALHAVIIGLIRHFSHKKLYKKPITNNSEFDFLKEVLTGIIFDRCKKVNPDELEKTKKLVNQRLYFWEKMGFQHYGDAGNYKIRQDDGYYPLMYANSSEIRSDIEGSSLATPTSMRGVDTESKIEPYTVS